MTSFPLRDALTGADGLPAADRRRRARRPVRPSTRFIRVSLGMINRLVRVADAATILGVTLIFWLMDAPHPAPLSLLQILIAAAVGAAVFVAVVQIWGGYRVERYHRVRSQGLDIALGLIAATATDRLVVWAFAPAALNSNHWLLVWLLGVLAGLTMGRIGSAMSIDVLRRRGLLRRRVAVVGATLLAGEVIRNVRKAEWHREFELAGLFDDGSPSPMVGRIADLRTLAQTSRIDLIVLALPWSQSDRIFALGDQLQWISADVVTPLEHPGFLTRSSLLTEVAGLPALQLTRHPFRGTQGLVKTAQDYAVAAIGLIAVSPILIGAAVALKLCGGGPVLFRQDRIGFNGRPFSIYKFRTMTVDTADDGAGGQVRDNPRITRLGALLRRTSIDELPQLLNVLRGEMSIVGPRPHVSGMRVGDGAYSDAVRSYAARHQIKPGITGWAQINGMRGGIDTLEKARRGVDLDLHYMRNWSLQLDLRIMIKTLTLHMAGPKVF
ncbi:exopolysaccharide biosynthesis polyprenyl glycosylphosphotransferase [Brevundimonas goettingensis]|uniref:Exopolysaccharide biosynthesis polyprenyl glycosylphosphotransferase n=1 Tax=Brevundimonas goettingensis TaxID=2774190 RepID=A0A975GVT9_9CAUL|nr:exopolysaccharide biosynthesis polyprenyl glycosylphosphotransferase [Brevundimonas goettingensis]QTC91841.1 exopolysaccharide biosynthesis polyprenyl glycosylphosphotransferase [Brevundimonas goettingensis]